MGHLSRCLNMRPQHVVLGEGEGAWTARSAEAKLQEQLDQHDPVRTLEAVEHEAGLLVSLAAAEQVVEVPEDICGTLALLKRGKSLRNLPVCHVPLKGGVGGVPALASDVRHERRRLVIDWTVVDVVQQPRPEATLLKAAQHITRAALKEAVDDPLNKLPILVLEVQLREVPAAIA